VIFLPYSQIEPNIFAADTNLRGINTMKFNRWLLAFFIFLLGYGSSVMADSLSENNSAAQMTSQNQSTQMSRQSGEKLAEGFKRVCKMTQGIDPNKYEDTLRVLAYRVAPVVSLEATEKVRGQYAKYLSARETYERSEEAQKNFPNLLKSIALGDLEDRLEVLKELENQIGMTGELRAARTELAGISVGAGGKIELTPRL